MVLVRLFVGLLLYHISCSTVQAASSRQFRSAEGSNVHLTASCMVGFSFDDISFIESPSCSSDWFLRAVY
jgi:hypothetical protein